MKPKQQIPTQCLTSLSLGVNLFTYGAELEFADIDQKRPLLEGCGWDRTDPSMVNSNGIAVDPKGISWQKGGEIQTRPTNTLTEQVDLFKKLLVLFPEATVNYRSNLHIHIGVPQLEQCLPLLKQLQEYISTQLPQVLAKLEPIPKPDKTLYPNSDALRGATKRYNRRKRSHQTFTPASRVTKQLAASSLKEFYELEVPRSKENKPLWHMQPRSCVNIRQLLQTKTIEFRHFPGTLDPVEFEFALTWCREFLWAGLVTREPVRSIFARLQLRMPKFKLYQHDLEQRYLQTCHDGSIKRPEVEINIQRLLDENT